MLIFRFPPKSDFTLKKKFQNFLDIKQEAFNPSRVAFKLLPFFAWQFFFLSLVSNVLAQDDGSSSSIVVTVSLIVEVSAVAVSIVAVLVAIIITLLIVPLELSAAKLPIIIVAILIMVLVPVEPVANSIVVII